jgi:hypothetical protein
VCYVERPLPIREPGQRSPPPVRAVRGSRWDQLPPTNRQRLLRLLGHLVERQLNPTNSEEARHDLHR